MLLDLATGRKRPMRTAPPVVSSALKAWDGFLLEEFPPSLSVSRHVSLMDSAVFLTIDDRVDLEWDGSGRTVSTTVSPGRISILPANHPYSVKLRAAGGTIVVSLEQKLLACAAAEQGMASEVEPVWMHGVDDALVRELVLALRAEARQSGQENIHYAQSLAATLSAHIVRRYSTDRMRITERPRGLSLPRLRRTVQFMQENLGEEISIQRLAAVAELSGCHFARMFKQSTGLSPHQYLLHCRIARAKQLLLNKSLSLAEVALQAGFCDQGHLTRAFRQLQGTTPGAYARSIRSGVHDKCREGGIGSVPGWQPT